jgi:hypothetical protein
MPLAQRERRLTAWMSCLFEPVAVNRAAVNGSATRSLA